MPPKKKPMTLMKALIYVFLIFFAIIVGWLIYISVRAAPLVKDTLCSPDLNGGKQDVCKN